MDQCFFDREPPDRSAKLPYLKLIRVPVLTTLHVVVISSDVVHTHIHRVDGHPFLCPGATCPIEGCPNCGYYEGYIEVLTAPNWERCMLALTSETYHLLRCISVENSLQMRGLQMVLERPTKHKKGAIAVKHWTVYREVRTLPAERDLRPFVLRLFKRR